MNEASNEKASQPQVVYLSLANTDVNIPLDIYVHESLTTVEISLWTALYYTARVR